MMDICDYIKEEEVYEVLYKYNTNKRRHHVEKVAYYSKLITELLSQSFQFQEEDKNMLLYAALLHDIGYYISKEEHQNHSKLIVLKEAFFDKLPKSERNNLAYIVSSHRKHVDEEIKNLSEVEQKSIIKLVSILRLCDALDYCKDIVLDKVYILNGLLILKVKEYPNIKGIKKLRVKSQLFKEVFNLNIELVYNEDWA